jgi:hypothetical protein
MRFLKNRRRELSSAGHAARSFARWYLAIFGTHPIPSSKARWSRSSARTGILEVVCVVEITETSFCAAELCILGIGT